MKHQLQKRKRGRHLKLEEKGYLVKEFMKDPKNNPRLRLRYKIPKSTYYALMKDKDNIMDELEKSSKKVESNSIDETDLEKHTILKLVKPPTFPVTIRSIGEHLEKKFGPRNRNTFIRRYLKKGLNYSFKKGSMSAPKSTNEKNMILKEVFSAKLLKLIHLGKYIVNVDESSFSRGITNQYSWVPKGKSSSVLTPVHSGR
jgi:hypothetical protein